MSRLAVLLAEGFEEVEAVTPIDFLRRSGIEVVTSSVEGATVRGSHGITIVVDRRASDLSDSELDGIVLPGGMPGSANLAASPVVERLVRAMVSSGKLVAAICAAPAKVLGPMGVLTGRRATCFPGDEISFASDVLFSEERVVRDGNLITSRGAGTAAEFAEEIVRYFQGEEAAQELHRRTVQKS